jgi:hypothetical protein
VTRLEVTVTYTDGRRVTRPSPLRDDAEGRKITEALAFYLMADDAVESVKVERTDRVAGGRRGTYR